MMNYRAGCVENFEHTLLAVDLDLLPVAVLDGRVVLLDEYALDELDGEGGLADATATQHDHLVFAHLCGSPNPAGCC